MKYYFNDTGTLEPSELRQYLNGPPLEIEVHDRDRKPEGVKLKPTLFGDDLEDEKISNVGTVASKSLLLHLFMTYGRQRNICLGVYFIFRSFRLRGFVGGQF